MSYKSRQTTMLLEQKPFRDSLLSDSGEAIAYISMDQYAQKYISSESNRMELIFLWSVQEKESNLVERFFANATDFCGAHRHSSVNFHCLSVTMYIRFHYNPCNVGVNLYKNASVRARAYFRLCNVCLSVCVKG